MKSKKNVFTFFGDLLRRNTFLKILSILLAIVVWIYILYIVNPVNENTFDRLEVSIPYAGSVPERNGFMYLMTDTNLTVNVTVSGSRSQLIRLSQSKLHATLNMDTVVSAGTYVLPVTVTVDQPDITVSEIYPKNFTIEFAEKASKTIPVELRATGTLPDGYLLGQTEFSPAQVTVTGPKNTIEEIEHAYMTVSLTNVKADIAGEYELALVNAAGESVDRRYLTVSDASVVATVAVDYQKTLPLTVELVNSSGGDESAYITVTTDVDQITGIGEETDLSKYSDRFSAGQIDTSALTDSTEVTLTVPETAGVTFRPETVTAKITFHGDVATKTLTYSPKTELTFLNVPSGKTARVTATDTLRIRVRARAEDLQKLNRNNLFCVVDLSQPNADGSYPVVVTSSTGLSYGIVGSYSVRVELN